VENKSEILILARTESHLIGLDVGLGWHRLDAANFAGGALDVIDSLSGARLRTAVPTVLQSERFQKLFDRDGDDVGLFHVQSLRIHMSGDDFKCDFSYNGALYENIDMRCPRFYIDGYEMPSADIVTDGRSVIGIFAARYAPVVINPAKPAISADPDQSDAIRRLEQRMSELQLFADEYNKLKAELVAKVKESCGELKQTYEWKFYRAIYTPPGVRRTVDSDKLKADGLYETYVKISKTSPSVRIVKISDPS